MTAEVPKHKSRPVIYQLFPRLLTNTNTTCLPNGTLTRNGAGHLADIDARVLDSIRGLGVNTLWLTGVIEMATKTDFTSLGIERDPRNMVKGEAGSPYAIKDFYDVSPAIAKDPEHRIEEFEALIGRIHAAGMKCIIDFVPNHTARVYHSDAAPEGTAGIGENDDTAKAFSPENDYYYLGAPLNPNFEASGYVENPAKATGNDCYTVSPSKGDWYETVKLNYGVDFRDRTEHFEPRPPLWDKMTDILLYWAGKGVDGFRCDMVFLVPLAFWHYAIPKVKEKFPEVIFIGEIYDTNLYRPYLDYGCFDYLYDKVNLYDTLIDITAGRHPASDITRCWQTTEGIAPSMLNFLENHDEVRLASTCCLGNPFKAIPALVVSSMIGSGAYMIYYGQELGEPALEHEGFSGYDYRTTIFDYWCVDTLYRWYDHGRCAGQRLTRAERRLRDTYSRILRLLNESPALREGAFFDLMYANHSSRDVNPNSLYLFLRSSGTRHVLVAANFSDVRRNAAVVLPAHAFEFLKMKEGTVEATDLLSDAKTTLSLRKDASVDIDVPPASAAVLSWDDKDVTEFK